MEQIGAATVFFLLGGGEGVSVVDGGYLELDGLDSLDEVFTPGCYLVLFGGVVLECFKDSWEPVSYTLLALPTHRAVYNWDVVVTCNKQP